MPKVLTEARSVAPELTDAVKALDEIAYTRQYAEVFADLVDWLIFQHSMPPAEENPLEKKYSEKEQALFLDAFKNIQSEVKKRVNMWTAADPKDYLSTGWYDPLGKIYETITSKYKSSMLGQFFTPKPVVDMMVQITNPGQSSKVETILDPCSGSGRMGLSAAAHAMSKGTSAWVSMNDVDGICTKMTAVNMALNGIVGEAVNMNGLDIVGESFRFAYRVAPILSFVPPEKWEFAKLMGLFRTGQDIQKQYVVQPIPYEQTYLKQVNDRLIKEWKERQKIANEKEKEAAIEELKNQVKSRMAGTLFEGDNSVFDNLEVPTEKRESKLQQTKKKPPASNGSTQGSLF